MNKEILVIDDNPDIRSLVSSILKEQNFSVRTAANYDQAVFEIHKKLPDLAIVDIKLDKTDKKILLDAGNSGTLARLILGLLVNSKNWIY